MLPNMIIFQATTFWLPLVNISIDLDEPALSKVKSEERWAAQNKDTFVCSFLKAIGESDLK